MSEGHLAPIRDSFKPVIVNCIVNADDSSDQKEMILIAYENGIFFIPETFAWIQLFELQSS